ncbi:MAG: hypothetical protein AAF570_11065 [Bacteroidota bacterium]
MKEFPPYFEFAHPYGPEDLPHSGYITSPKGLSDPAAPEIAPAYADFFQHAPQRLQALAQSVENPEFAQWLDSLAQMDVLLETHGYDPLPPGPRHILGFHDLPNFTEWQNNWPCYGISVILVDSADVPETVPAALREVYRLGAVWIWGWPGSGNFLNPDELLPVPQVEYIGDYMRDCYPDSSLNFEEIIPFYSDSGCWLMYDKSETVYCGGVECGECWNSGLKLDTVIANIFRGLRTGARNNIESFAPKPKS